MFIRKVKEKPFTLVSVCNIIKQQVELRKQSNSGRRATRTLLSGEGLEKKLNFVHVEKCIQLIAC